MRRVKAFLKRNKILILVMIAVGVYYGYTHVITEQKLSEYHATESELMQEIESLERELNRLEDAYAYAQNPEAIERLAREKLKMVMPNEVIYIIRENEEKEDD
ncbi:FtsB family cell division protein [Fusibacter tunisiensis]|uniref:Cell division protein FtsB n=1 Tax=Fusibacter tunisiensis TaxID=1008308 RepID=A0ABS2MRB2_9FIRM|nr:septum formation initiator family protein [Fusibacter tunisiensis]MBM7561905.1 cell division protein FtsB [Fusibacter tunisiensis]